MSWPSLVMIALSLSMTGLSIMASILLLYLTVLPKTRLESLFLRVRLRVSSILSTLCSNILKVDRLSAPRVVPSSASA